MLWVTEKEATVALGNTVQASGPDTGQRPSPSPLFSQDHEYTVQSAHCTAGRTAAHPVPPSSLGSLCPMGLSSETAPFHSHVSRIGGLVSPRCRQQWSTLASAQAISSQLWVLLPNMLVDHLCV